MMPAEVSDDCHRFIRSTKPLVSIEGVAVPDVIQFPGSAWEKRIEEFRRTPSAEALWELFQDWDPNFHMPKTRTPLPIGPLGAALARLEAPIEGVLRHELLPELVYAAGRVHVIPRGCPDPLADDAPDAASSLANNETTESKTGDVAAGVTELSDTDRLARGLFDGLDDFDKRARSASNPYGFFTLAWGMESFLQNVFGGNDPAEIISDYINTIFVNDKDRKNAAKGHAFQIGNSESRPHGKFFWPTFVNEADLDAFRQIIACLSKLMIVSRQDTTIWPRSAERSAAKQDQLHVYLCELIDFLIWRDSANNADELGKSIGSHLNRLAPWDFTEDFQKAVIDVMLHRIRYHPYEDNSEELPEADAKFRAVAAFLPFLINDSEQEINRRRQRGQPYTRLYLHHHFILWDAIYETHPENDPEALKRTNALKSLCQKIMSNKNMLLNEKIPLAIDELGYLFGDYFILEFGADIDGLAISQYDIRRSGGATIYDVEEVMDCWQATPRGRDWLRLFAQGASPFGDSSTAPLAHPNFWDGHGTPHTEIAPAARYVIFHRLFREIRDEGLEELAAAWWAFFLASQVALFGGRLLLPPMFVEQAAQLARELRHWPCIDPAVAVVRACAEKSGAPLEQRVVCTAFRDWKPASVVPQLVPLQGLGTVEGRLRDVLGDDFDKIPETMRHDLIRAETEWLKNAHRLGAGEDHRYYGKDLIPAVEAWFREAFAPLWSELKASCDLRDKLTLGSFVFALDQVRRGGMSNAIQGEAASLYAIILEFEPALRDVDNLREKPIHNNRLKEVDYMKLRAQLLGQKGLLRCPARLQAASA